MDLEHQVNLTDSLSGGSFSVVFCSFYSHGCFSLKSVGRSV